MWRAAYLGSCVVGYISIFIAFVHALDTKRRGDASARSHAMSLLLLSASILLKAPYFFDSKRTAFWMILATGLGWLAVFVVTVV